MCQSEQIYSNKFLYLAVLIMHSWFAVLSITEHKSLVQMNLLRLYCFDKEKKTETIP